MQKSRYVFTSYLANAIIGRYGTVSPQKTFEIIQKSKDHILVSNKIGVDKNVYKIAVMNGAVDAVEKMLQTNSFLPIRDLKEQTVHKSSKLEDNDYTIKLAFNFEKAPIQIEIESITKEFI